VSRYRAAARDTRPHAGYQPYPLPSGYGLTSPLARHLAPPPLARDDIVTREFGDAADNVYHDVLGAYGGKRSEWRHGRSGPAGGRLRAVRLDLPGLAASNAAHGLLLVVHRLGARGPRGAAG